MPATHNFPTDYLDYSGRDDMLSGGVKMIPINTSQGTFKVWTKRIGNNPGMKVLLLHGGPGASHEYLEAFDSYLPAASIEYYYYDQLGCHYSDQPHGPELVNVAHSVDEVEQVRQALHLTQDNFYLYGHSSGGLVAIEYALKYQQHLKGLIASNVMASVPQANTYAREVLMPQIDPLVLAEIQQYEAAADYENPRYRELLLHHHQVVHTIRLPVEDWPDPVNRAFAHINPDIYTAMQGPTAFETSGILADWDRTADLAKIEVPSLVIGAQYDTADPAHLEWMAHTMPNGRYWYCQNGSHLALYDDQQAYFRGLIQFIRDVDAGGI